MSEFFEQGYALLIGVGESAYPPLSLPVTVRDTQSLYAALIDPEICAYPGDREHIRVLNNGEASRSQILDGLAWLQDQSRANPEVTILVYFSGHGWWHKETGDFYLIQHDIKPGKLAATALPAQAFSQAVREIRAERVWVVIDSCHAAGMAASETQASGTQAFGTPASGTPASKEAEAAQADAELMEEFDDFQRLAPSKGLIDALAKGKGRVVFTSSTGEQKSYILPDKSNSIYTYHFLEALQGANNQAGDREVKISNLMNYLGKTVPESAWRVALDRQTPQFDITGGDFAVARLRGGKGLPEKGWDAVQPEASQKIQQFARVIHQHGKYIVNIQKAEHIHIGDQITRKDRDKS